MSASADTATAAILLANRLTRVDAEPLRAAEYWPLLDRVPDPAALLGRSEGQVARMVGDAALASRVVRLLGAAVAVAFARERLEETGIRVVSSFHDEFPVRLRERLGDRCPAVLLVAGPPLVAGGIGVVGVREPSPDGAAVAARAGERVVALGERLVSGLSPGVDQLALDAVLAGGGTATLVPPEGLAVVAGRAVHRSLVLGGRVTLCSPYAPDAVRTSVTARGRNRIVYGLAACTLVVASDGDVDTTWVGARDALTFGDGPVVAWVGPGCGTTNEALVAEGARPLADLAVLR